jgi:hypothetical protein
MAKKKYILKESYANDKKIVTTLIEGIIFKVGVPVECDLDSEVYKDILEDYDQVIKSIEKETKEKKTEEKKAAKASGSATPARKPKAEKVEESKSEE